MTRTQRFAALGVRPKLTDPQAVTILRRISDKLPMGDEHRQAVDMGINALRQRMTEESAR